MLLRATLVILFMLNLGAAGKGLGNGMSGGFLYQYDPDGVVRSRVSDDSLLVFGIADDEHGDFHSAAVRLLLGWHRDATGSELAARLLADFVILDKNPLTTPVGGIKDIRVLETIKEGTTVWRAAPR